LGSVGFLGGAAQLKVTNTRRTSPIPQIL